MVMLVVPPPTHQACTDPAGRTGEDGMKTLHGIILSISMTVKLEDQTGPCRTWRVIMRLLQSIVSAETMTLQENHEQIPDLILHTGMTAILENKL